MRFSRFVLSPENAKNEIFKFCFFLKIQRMGYSFFGTVKVVKEERSL